MSRISCTAPSQNITLPSFVFYAKTTLSRSFAPQRMFSSSESGAKSARLAQELILGKNTRNLLPLILSAQQYVQRILAQSLGTGYGYINWDDRAELSISIQWAVLLEDILYMMRGLDIDAVKSSRRESLNAALCEYASACARALETHKEVTDTLKQSLSADSDVSPGSTKRICNAAKELSKFRTQSNLLLGELLDQVDVWGTTVGVRCQMNSGLVFYM